MLIPSALPPPSVSGLSKQSLAVLSSNSLKLLVWDVIFHKTRPSAKIFTSRNVIVPSLAQL
jgi:hypothetical protein